MLRTNYKILIYIYQYTYTYYTYICIYIHNTVNEKNKFNRPAIYKN